MRATRKLPPTAFEGACRHSTRGHPLTTKSKGRNRLKRLAKGAEQLPDHTSNVFSLKSSNSGNSQNLFLSFSASVRHATDPPNASNLDSRTALSNARTAHLFCRRILRRNPLPQPCHLGVWETDHHNFFRQSLKGEKLENLCMRALGAILRV